MIIKFLLKVNIEISTFKHVNRRYSSSFIITGRSVKWFVNHRSIAIIGVTLTFPISSSKIQPTLRTYANPLSCYQVVMSPSWQLSPIHYHYSRPHHTYKFPLSPIVLNLIFITVSNPNRRQFNPTRSTHLIRRPQLKSLPSDLSLTNCFWFGNPFWAPTILVRDCCSSNSPD